MIIFNGNIDLNKIDESKIVEGRNGARYLNITAFVNDEKNQYGYDVDMIQQMTKEERLADAKKIYLGNGVQSFKK